MAPIVVVRLQTLALPLPATSKYPDEGLNTQKENANVKLKETPCFQFDREVKSDSFLEKKVPS